MFFQAGLRRRNEEATGLEMIGDKIEADNLQQFRTICRGAMLLGVT
jgi:hypothetical protein